MSTHALVHLQRRHIPLLHPTHRALHRLLQDFFICDLIHVEPSLLQQHLNDIIGGKKERSSEGVVMSFGFQRVGVKVFAERKKSREGGELKLTKESEKGRPDNVHMKVTHGWDGMESDVVISFLHV
jgi:hypothetical protein